MDNFINTAASDISRARTVGLNQLTPEPFPVLVVGTRSTQGFFFANRGTLESWSGDSSYGLRLTIGDILSPPQGATFTATVGSGDPLTLPFDLDAAGLQNALNDDATIETDGGIDVRAQGLGRFLIAYRELGTPSDIAVDGALLFPNCSAELTVLTAGDSATRQLLMLTLRTNTPAQVTSWTPITSGWSGVIDLTSAAAYELIRLKGQPVAGGLLQCPTVLTVEVIDPSGNAACYYQTPIQLRGLNYMDTTTLPFGPTRNAQTSTVAGAVTVAPSSQMHTERLTFTGTGTRNVVVSPTGLLAGAHVDLVCIVSGADDGILINVYQVSTGGTKLIQFTKATDDTNTFFALRATGAGGFNNVDQSVPAYTDA